MKQASIFDMFNKKKRKTDQDSEKPIICPNSASKRLRPAGPEATPNKSVIINVDSPAEFMINAVAQNDLRMSVSPESLVNDTPPMDKSYSMSDMSPQIDESISTGDFVFAVGHDKYSVCCISLTDDIDAPIAWISRFRSGLANAKSPALIKAVIGVDCEWCPPWFRDNGPEKVCTIQIFCPLAGALVLSTAGVSSLPSALEEIFADESILKVGVNIAGDGARIARDFKCPVHGLLDVAKGKRASLEDLCKKHCPAPFHVSKDSVESKVRLGNWAAWPLSELQVKYASMDAVISYLIYLYQSGGTWEKRLQLQLPLASLVKVESAFPKTPEEGHEDNEEKPELRRNESTSSVSSTHSNFFMMQQNRSIVPPTRGVKEYPQGSATCLKGVVVVVSGVLDSMTRDELGEYVKKHGGKVGKSITKSTTHLVNDLGSIGPSKLKACEAQGIPIVGEDAIFELVRSAMHPAP